MGYIMDYLEIKKHIRTDNQSLLKFMQEKEIQWLEKHFKFINGLLMGRIKVDELNVLPHNLKIYKDFISTIRDKKKPTTEEEKIYLKFIEYFKQEINNKNVKPKDPNTLFNGLQINPSGSIPYPEEMSDKLDAEYETESYSEWVDDWKYR
jgi:uncharacterized protein YifE (UPF0438 family)